MSERMLTTDYVRKTFGLCPVNTAECNHLNDTPDFAEGLFDRWLEAHDRDVRAQALEDVADAMDADTNVRDPLRIRADWLRARAEKERQSGNPTTPTE